MFCVFELSAFGDCSCKIRTRTSNTGRDYMLCQRGFGLPILPGHTANGFGRASFISPACLTSCLATPHFGPNTEQRLGSASFLVCCSLSLTRETPDIEAFTPPMYHSHLFLIKFHLSFWAVTCINEYQRLRVSFSRSNIFSLVRCTQVLSFFDTIECPKEYTRQSLRSNIWVRKPS